MKSRNNMRRLMSQRMYESMRNECYSRFHNRRVVKMDRDFDPIFEAEDDKKPACKCKFNGKLVNKMNKVEKRDAKESLRSQISDLKKQIKEAKKNGRATKAMETKLEKFQYTLDCLMGRCGDVNESVTSRFKRHSFLFESEDNENSDEESDETEDEESDKATDDTDGEFDSDSEETADDKVEYEDVEMKAIVLTVAGKNVETVKQGLIDAGVAEDDIKFDEPEDEESNVDIRVDVKSIDSLKEYLNGVGINLEDELDGEIVSDGDAKTDDSSEEEPSNDAEDNTEDDVNFDDLFADEN